MRLRGKMITAAKNDFQELVKIMARLRSARGCAWDRAQTHQTLLPYLFEEANEVVEAIKKNDYKNLEEELGDILLQVVFHAQLAAEKKKFTIQEVIRTLVGKLKRRHPHVFGRKKLNSVAEIISHWEKIKQREKKQKTGKLKK